MCLIASVIYKIFVQFAEFDVAMAYYRVNFHKIFSKVINGMKLKFHTHV